jgi:hypothetical protein
MHTKFWKEKPEGKMKDNIAMDLKEIGYEGMVQVRDK